MGFICGFVCTLFLFLSATTCDAFPTYTRIRCTSRNDIRTNRLPIILQAHSLDSYDDHNIIPQQSTSAKTIPKQSTQSTSAKTPFIGLPSYRRIIFFVATTFLIWVSEPLLSLVDSAAVGRYAGKSLSTSTSLASPNLSSVVQLAALGPATTVCDSSLYLTLFIAMATTNKLATAFAKKDLEEQITTLSHVMGVSLVVGTIVLLFINLQGESLLGAILGPAGATVSVAAARGAMKSIDLTPQVLHASLGYARIRSIVSPLSVMGLTSQAALLCAQDTKTPALAVLVASVVNIVGDYIFVAKMRWGVWGAAAATSIASFSANTILLRKVWQMFSSWKHAYREKMKDEQAIPSSQKEDTVQDDQKDPLDIPFISFPDRKSLTSLLLLAGPMFFVMLGKIFGYTAMTIRSGDFGMTSLACHNVLMRIFFFFATVGDALSQSAQTFLPGLFYRKSLQEKDANDVDDKSKVSTHSDGANDARTLVKRLLLLSSTMGIVNCISGRYIAHNSGRAFTSDSTLVSLMSHVSPFMGLALLLHPLTMALEVSNRCSGIINLCRCTPPNLSAAYILLEKGSIIAASDSNYLVGTYIASILVLLGWLKFVCQDFRGVWHGILMFQMLRITQFGARVWKRTASQKAKKKLSTQNS